MTAVFLNPQDMLTLHGHFLVHQFSFFYTTPLISDIYLTFLFLFCPCVVANQVLHPVRDEQHPVVVGAVCKPQVRELSVADAVQERQGDSRDAHGQVPELGHLRGLRLRRGHRHHRRRVRVRTLQGKVPLRRR